MGYECVSLNRLFDVSDRFWVPLLDVEETREELVIRADLPGLKKEDMKLQIEGSVLVLAGARKPYGQFQRALQLPSEVDGGRATAAYEAGVLTVRLPKREEAKPKEIAIEVK